MSSVARLFWALAQASATPHCAHAPALTRCCPRHNLLPTDVVPCPPTFIALQIRLSFVISTHDVKVATDVLDHVMKKDVGGGEDEEYGVSARKC
jgi:hypothetical protein